MYAFSYSIFLTAGKEIHDRETERHDTNIPGSELLLSG